MGGGDFARLNMHYSREKAYLHVQNPRDALKNFLQGGFRAYAR